MSLRFFLFMLVSLFLVPVKGQPAVINGTATDFAGDSLEFFTCREPLFSIKYPEGRVKVTEEGKFRLTVDADKTECLFVEAGPYLAFLFVEPGKTYETALPLINNFSDEWKKNPYFTRAPFQLNVTCSGCGADSLTGLNSAIRSFNLQFEPFRDKQLIRYYSPALHKSKLDSFRMANPIPGNLAEKEYFRRYRKYRIGTLEFAVKGYNTDSLISEYFLDEPVDFTMPPYAELFRMVFDDYFGHLSHKDQYRDIYRVFGHFSYEEMKSFLNNAPAMSNDTIFGTVLLGEIYSSYYSGNFPKEKLITYARSVEENSDNRVTKDMAEILIRKFIRLQPGFPAPPFKLKDTGGNERSLKDFAGKYVLLGFCDRLEMSSLIELEYLKDIAARYASYLSVVTIFPAEDPGDIKQFANTNGLDWTILVAPDSAGVFRDYDVRAFPVFYLIGKDGDMVRSPVAEPSQGFAQVLYNVMKEKGEL